MSKVISELLWFCITSLSDLFNVLAPFFQPIRGETKTNRGSPCTFSRALCWLRVITSSFDWFTGLSPSFLIGQSNYFGFGFTKLDKTRSKELTHCSAKGRIREGGGLIAAAVFSCSVCRLFSVRRHHQFYLIFNSTCNCHKNSLDT